MLTHFTCILKQDKDEPPINPGDSRMYPAKINDNQLVVMKIVGVGDDEDISLVNLCDGLLESEALSLLSSSSHDSASVHFNSLVYIEKVGQHVIYR